MDKKHMDNGKQGFTLRELLMRLLKATIKSVLVYLVFFLFSMLMGPLRAISKIQTISFTLIALYISFIFIIELTRGTVYQHVFSIANSLFMICYFAYLLNSSEFNLSLEQVEMTVDLHFFMSVFLISGLVGFAKSMLNFIHWINEKEERSLNYQIMSA